MYYDLTECGKRIAQLRAESRLTQLQAAEKLNISVQHYRSVEAGRRGASIELLVEMANTFHTYNKTISKGVVLLILLSSKIGYTAGVATCSIIRSSTVDLYLYSYSKTVLR